MDYGFTQYLNDTPPEGEGDPRVEVVCNRCVTPTYFLLSDPWAQDRADRWAQAHVCDDLAADFGALIEFIARCWGPHAERVLWAEDDLGPDTLPMKSVHTALEWANRREAS